MHLREGSVVLAYYDEEGTAGGPVEEV